ncbi:hypothetical protein NQ314_003464 [Rhamnusium bicolor]|uniref:Uncharacterized protein n=1 Tax=Rhamnusium bicolor TaxID=1586634 RepID=A0AAV8ZLQ3_9CUCU|nr:hypothetical protein NQ314_003464 [Rhamnusium bicolor]
MVRSSPELMPSIMGAFDAIIGTQPKEKDFDVEIKSSTPRKTHQVRNFASLSPCVQKNTLQRSRPRNQQKI